MFVKYMPDRIPLTTEDALLPSWQICLSPSGDHLAILKDSTLWVRGVSKENAHVPPEEVHLTIEVRWRINECCFFVLNNMLSIFF